MNMFSCYHLPMLALVLSISFIAVSRAALAGGFSEERSAEDNDIVAKALLDVKEDFLMKSRLSNVDQFTAVTYRSQVVAGTNYLVKVKLGENSFAHLRIFKSLPHVGMDSELKGYQLDKTEEDALETFDPAFPVAKRVGATSDEAQHADSATQELVNKIREDFARVYGSDTTSFDAISYRKQVVAGTNYFVKVRIDGHNYVHLRIHQSLSGNVQLTGYQSGKKLADSIEYFAANIPTTTPKNTSTSSYYQNPVFAFIAAFAALIF